MLLTFGFRRFPNDHALYYYKNPHDPNDIMFVCTSTDDFLSAFSRPSTFLAVRDHISKYVNVTSQQGYTLNYLNLRIIQSRYGISIDQTEHIKENILDLWFPNGEYVKTVYTPFRTDGQFERDLSECLPADDQELAQLEFEYKGSFPRLMGQVQHVAVWTRIDISFGCARLSKYVTVPSRITFEAMKRLGRYLYHNPHRPIMYPRHLSLTGTHLISNNYNDGRSESHTISNNFSIFVDADHARDQRTRKSMTFYTATLGGVAVDHAAKQQGPTALHSTDAEILGFSTATKKAIFFHDLALFLELPTAGDPITIYEDSQPAIDVLTSNALSSRIKHIAVPIAFANEKIVLGIVSAEYIKTTLQPADGGTKPQSGPILERIFNYLIGVRFYPRAGSKHYVELDLDSFKTYYQTKTNVNDVKETP